MSRGTVGAEGCYGTVGGVGSVNRGEGAAGDGAVVFTQALA